MSHCHQQPYVLGHDPRQTRGPMVDHKLHPQTATVLRHMKITGKITNLEAHTVLKVRSVSSRISELIKAGYHIDKRVKRDSTNQWYVEYSLDPTKRW